MKRLLVVLAILALAPAMSARADIIHMGNWTPGGQVGIHVGTGDLTVLVGAVPGTVGSQTFDMYCVSDLNIGGLPADFYYPGVQNMATDWAAVQPIASTNLQGMRAAYLYNTFATTADVDRSALQLAIWNAVFDDDFSVTTGVGSFYATSGSWTGTANTYLANLMDAQNKDGFFADAGYYRLYTPVSSGTDGTEVQGFVGPQPVPEPGSMLLLGTGLFGLAGVARRRRRK